MPTPHANRITLAPAVVMVPIRELAETLNVSENSAGRILKALKVPFAYFGKHRYFLQQALEEALFVALELGGPGFIASGSTEKAHGKCKDGVLELDMNQIQANRMTRRGRIKDARETNKSAIRRQVMESLQESAKGGKKA